MIFTEFEKRIINTIAAQDLNTIHPTLNWQVQN